MSEMLQDEIDEFDLEADPSIEELTSPEIDRKRIAVIRTSDRNNYRRCRRRWNWQSHLRGNLTPVESASPLWFGTGFHYAMEDFHGLRKFDHPVKAFEAYVKATYKQAKGDPRRLPYDWLDLIELGRGMLGYYADTWMVARDPLRTFVFKGVPQVEVHVQFPLPIKSPYYDEVIYGATLDRVVIDDNGELWIVDYKTAKRIQTQFLQTDPQISAYCWLASQLYGMPIAGFIYQQHRKDIPEDPRILATGKVSTAKGLKTTHRHYRRSLLNIYGDVEFAPKANIDYLNRLNEIETVERDLFIRRDRVFRNQRQIEAEGVKCLLEVEEMLNHDLPLYPNPTRECAHLCSFNSPCVSLDDGGDWEHELEIGFRPKDSNFDSWRVYLPKELQ
jgi:hypothetical protein